MHRDCERKIPIRIARVLCTRNLSLFSTLPVKVALSLFLPLATLRFSYTFAAPFFLFTGLLSFGPSLFHARSFAFSSHSHPNGGVRETREDRRIKGVNDAPRQLQVRVLVTARETSARSETTKRKNLPVYPETF